MIERPGQFGTGNRPTDRDRALRVRKAPWKRMLVGLASIVLLTAGAIGCVLWWEDRPLRAIEQALDRQEFEQALDLANGYLKDFSSNSRVLDQKARALAGLERWTEALRIFDLIGADTFASQKAWAHALLFHERWNEALPLLTRLGEIAPQDGDVLHELSACCAKLGYFDESIRAAERLVRLSDHERRGRLLLGTIHYRRGNNRLAIQAWQPLLEQKSDLDDLQTPAAGFLLAYGRALLDDGRPAEALAQLERSAGLDPTAETLDALAEACDGMGDRDRAVSLWEQAVARNANDRPAREGLAQAALEKKLSSEAQRWLEPLLSDDDLRSSTAFLAQRAATIAGDREEAARWAARAGLLREREKKINALEQSLRETPHSFWSRCVRAHHFASDGNPAQALVLAEELLKQKPDEPFVRQLADAVRNHKPLPPLDMIPIRQF